MINLQAKSIETTKGNDKAKEEEERDSRPLSVEEVSKLGHYCRLLEEKLCSFSKDDTIKIVIDKSVYNYIDEEGTAESFESLLTIVEIRQMFRNQWLNVVTLQTWGRYVNK